MASEDKTITLVGARDEVTGGEVVLATKRDSITGIHTLVAQATGVTFDGTLDPTNLALEAGNLAKLPLLLAMLAPTLGTPQKLAVGAASAAVGVAIGTTKALLVSTVDCHVLFGAAPTATTNHFFLPAKIPMIFTCLDTDKVAAIRETGDGSLYVTSIS